MTKFFLKLMSPDCRMMSDLDKHADRFEVLGDRKISLTSTLPTSDWIDWFYSASNEDDKPLSELYLIEGKEAIAD